MLVGASNGRGSPRQNPGFFSSARTFRLPMGERFDARTVRGYYIDMRAKADSPTLLASATSLHVVPIQRGLGCYERYLAGEGDVWLAGAIAQADTLVRCQQQHGPQAGGFLHDRPFRHTFALRAPWISSMAQGEGASLLVRAFLETREERYAEAATRALLPLSVDSSAGGVQALLPDGRPFPEEYPTDPPSFVLNGGIFTLWGIRDVGVGLRNAAAEAAFESAVDSLAANLHRWDLGYWSRYDLYPHPVTNIASSFYHDLHISQLAAMDRIAPRQQLTQTAERWRGYAQSPLRRRRAVAGKAVFRVLVPRNATIASRLPWSPLRTR
jgi:heparosan-N-sulfate-glucuronate 5-epimerase